MAGIANDFDIRFTDGNNNALNGGSVYFYTAGTSTPKDTYPTLDDATNDTNPNPNPIVCDANGRPYNSAVIKVFMETDEGYKIIIKDADGNTINTIDDYWPTSIVEGAGDDLEVIGNLTVGGTADVTGATTVSTLTASGAVTAQSTLTVTDTTTLNSAASVTSGGLTVTGSSTFNNSLTISGATNCNSGVNVGTSALAVNAANTFWATQANQETGTSTVVAVSPGRQHYHPSAVKVWCRVNNAGTMQRSFNMTSVTDTGTGTATFNFAITFSDSAYCSVISPQASTTTTRIISTTSPTTTTLTAECLSASFTAADPQFWNLVIFGDL
jgi:hypothetical protein